MTRHTDVVMTNRSVEYQSTLSDGSMVYLRRLMSYLPSTGEVVGTEYDVYMLVRTETRRSPSAMSILRTQDKQAALSTYSHAVLLDDASRVIGEIIFA